MEVRGLRTELYGLGSSVHASHADDDLFVSVVARYASDDDRVGVVSRKGGSKGSDADVYDTRSAFGRVGRKHVSIKRTEATSAEASGGSADAGEGQPCTPSPDPHPSSAQPHRINQSINNSLERRSRADQPAQHAQHAPHHRHPVRSPTAPSGIKG